jgi:hypothetical protein
VVYADNVNLLENNINIAKKDKETLIEAILEVSLEANTEYIKYIFKSRRICVTKITGSSSDDWIY